MTNYNCVIQSSNCMVCTIGNNTSEHGSSVHIYRCYKENDIVVMYNI